MKKFLLFAVAAVMFAACSKDAINEQSTTNPFDEAPETLTVGFEDDQTRIELNEAQKTVWTKGDLVSVFYRSDANQKWQYTGETGERVAELTRVEAGVATEAMKRVVVVYPYNENYYINTETYNVQATLPAVQNYLKDSYGLDGNIMISSSEYNQFSLKSVCGWLKLQLTGNGEKITSITLKGNNGEQVAGELYINSADATSTLASQSGTAGDDSQAGGNLVFEDTILKELTLECGEGVTLGAEATAFYIALPPQTFKEGFTIDIRDVDGFSMTKSTNKGLTIMRNTIQPMSPFMYEAEIPGNYNITYYATEKIAENTEHPWTVNTFGAEVVSHIWNSDTGEGVITFNRDVTKITDWAFYGCNVLTGIRIPVSVTTIGNEAFGGCTGLEKVYIDNIEMWYNMNINHKANPLTNEADLYVDDKLYTDLIIPEVVTYFTHRFLGCTSIENVVLHDKITGIQDSAFYLCSGISNVYINSLESYYKINFENDTAMPMHDIADLYVNGELFTEWIVPSNHDAIRWYFRGCSSLKRVVIHDGVSMIGDSAFFQCTNLSDIVWGGVEYIDNWAFYGCKGLVNLELSDKIAHIGDGVFDDCDNLESVKFGRGLVNIPGNIFGNCTKLKDVTFANNVEGIGWQSFYGIAVDKIVLPQSVKRIEYKAFDNCQNLTEVYCKAVDVPVAEKLEHDTWVAFGSNKASLKIYVPAESFEAYKVADGWSEYADNFVAYDFEKGEVVVPGTTIVFDPNHCIYYRANMTGGWDSGYGNYRAYRSYINFVSSYAGAVAVIEMKFKLKTISQYGDAYLGSGSNRAKDSCDELYITNSSLRFYSSAKDDSFSKTWNWTDLGVNYTDLITLQISAADDTVTVNGKVQQCDGFIMPSFSYLFSSYYREYDEGEWKEYEGVPDGSALYYVKMLTSTGKVAYLGYAAKALNPATNKLECCWYSKYSNGTETYQFAHDAINQGGYTGNF